MTTEAERLAVRLATFGLRLDGVEHKLARSQGAQGPQGAQGAQGPPPRHEWNEERDRIRFEQGDDGWGQWSESLRGPAGYGAPGIPGPQGATGPQGANVSGGSGTASDADVPLKIASDETYTVPANVQRNFSMTIDCEGILDVEGFLVAVD